MASQSSPFVSDTTQVRVELRNIIDEKALLDDIEGGLERARSKEDDERTKKRKKEDSEIVRKRAVADAQREARQEELCRCENAVRAKLKTCKLLADSLYPTPPAAPSVRSRDNFEDSDSIIPSSASGKPGTHKRLRTGGAVPPTELPEPPVSYETNASPQSRKRASLPKGKRSEACRALVGPTRSLQEMVPLHQFQSLPPAVGTADLPKFADMPSFTREFVSEFVGGSNSKCGLIPVGKDKKSVQIVECNEYLVLKPTLNPYVPCAPGQHFAFLDLQSSSNFELGLDQGRVFPVFLYTGNGCWSYSGHYKESFPAEKVTETAQRQLVSKTMLDEWVGSLFARSDYLTDFGLQVLLNSGRYNDPNVWKTITKEVIKLAINTKSRTGPYTQIPFWFRFLRCERFDHAFHDTLVGKKLEVTPQ